MLTKQLFVRRFGEAIVEMGHHLPENTKIHKLVYAGFFESLRAVADAFPEAIDFHTLEVDDGEHDVACFVGVRASAVPESEREKFMKVQNIIASVGESFEKFNEIARTINSTIQDEDFTRMLISKFFVKLGEHVIEFASKDEATDAGGKDFESVLKAFDVSSAVKQ